MIDVARDPLDFRYRLAGTMTYELHGQELTGKSITALRPPEFVATLWADLRELIETYAGGVRGGEQKIWTAGLNWYPNDVLRFILDYQHTDVDRLTAAGGNANAKIDAISFRSQFAF